MFADRKRWVISGTSASSENSSAISVTKDGKPILEDESVELDVFEEQVMYWRKANHIHKWFVDNVQNGEDNCEQHYVSPEAMRKLLGVCEEVLQHSELVRGKVVVGKRLDQENHTWIELTEMGKVIKDATVAKRLLPCSAGFFFGSTDYDECYLKDVVATRDWLTTMFADKLAGVEGEVFYCSNW